MIKKAVSNHSLFPFNDIEIKFLNNPRILFKEHHLSIISKLFLNFSLILDSKPLPEFYCIDNIALSLNSLQRDRYPGKKFRYCLTEDRKAKIVEILQLIENDVSFIKLTGMPGLGKSYFLSDFVLRQRVQGKSSPFRIIYVNNSDEYLTFPYRYLLNELKFMLFCEFSIDLVRGKLLAMLVDDSIESLKNNLKWLKNYYNGQGIKVVLIWDQINAIDREQGKYSKAEQLFHDFEDGLAYFDSVSPLQIKKSREQISKR